MIFSVIIKKVNLLKEASILFEIDNKVFVREFDIPSKDVNEQITYLKGSEIYIAYDDGIPTGFFAYESGGNLVELKTMAVLPSHQGQGAGKLMMEKFLGLVRGKEIYLVTHPKNSGAIIFYLKFGFEICDWVDGYFGDNEPRLKLRLK